MMSAAMQHSLLDQFLWKNFPKPLNFLPFPTSGVPFVEEDIRLCKSETAFRISLKVSNLPTNCFTSDEPCLLGRIVLPADP